MKTFYTDGTGSQQTLNDSQTEKVVVYDTINDAEADLANLAEGQIIATKDDDFEGNATPVNEVALNNMHSVTSNAVANALNNATIYETYQGTYYHLERFGRVVTFNLYGSFNVGTHIELEPIPSKYKPQDDVRGVFVRNSNDSPVGQIIVRPSGAISLYSGVGSISDDTYVANLTWILA